jgi:hypothetical protein
MAELFELNSPEIRAFRDLYAKADLAPEVIATSNLKLSIGGNSRLLP